jgi:hypothetical protein
MIGTIVNTGAILIGSTAGSLFKRGIGEKYENALYTACGLAAFGIGINTVVSNMPNSEYPILFIVSLVIGSLIGTKLNIDDRFNQFVNSRSSGNLAQGLTTGILLYCIGSLSIVGPVMSALYGDHTFLFTNASLDLVTSTILASTYGLGMALAAIVLFCWQGSIYLLTKCLSASFFSDAFVTELCVVGGFLIMCTGCSILNIRKFKTLDLLPSLLVPIIFFTAKQIIGF